MANIADCLTQVQLLTQRNLDILQAINDSFFTKQNHLSVNIGDTSYAIPSFISLENKISYLQENFNNLINAPETGEAFFNMDGNSRTIQLRSYEAAPMGITLPTVQNFNVYENDIFKDFLTPVPHVTFSLSKLPNDITSVNIKKIIPKNPDLLARFKGLLVDGTENLASRQYNFSDIYKMLDPYKEDADYIEYDTVQKLPIRKNIGVGTYVIEKIVEDKIDDNLDNFITLKFRTDIEDSTISNKLSYKLFDETIEKSLVEGDELVTYNGFAKMRIEKLNHVANTVTIKVLNGEYLNLAEYDGQGTDIPSLAKIRFYSPIDFDNDKYINVPLEEDQYIFIAVAPLNDRMNVQSSWGTGLLLNTYMLTYGDVGFKSYYDENVKNIGDVLFEMTSMMSNTLTKFSQSEFETLTKTKPTISKSDILVTQINKHLNNSTTVQNIRTLYSQKSQYNTELNEINTKIADINNTLSSISFDDTTGLRSVYTSQLTEYNTRKNELLTSLMKVVDEISLAANASEIPIENAKYHIRGFFDVEKFANELNMDGVTADDINGIRVRYRYKNLDQPQSNAQSINGKFLYTDWVDSPVVLRKRKPGMVDNKYKFEPENYNGNENVPSFNQIDIPISQGETVDIQLQVLYHFGYPYVETSSEWSDIVNIEFPEEFLKDVQILDIIKENNSDIETNRFENIIKEHGIPSHIDDKIIDQDLTYFHRPENISSGFYTAERRIIPLKDKLSTMDSAIALLQSEIQGSNPESLEVSIINGDVTNTLYPYQINQIHVEPYKDFESMMGDETGDSVTVGSYIVDPKTKIVSTILNISIKNISDGIVKLFSLFPGRVTDAINELKNYKFNINDYIQNQLVSGTVNYGGVNMKYYIGTTDTTGGSNTAWKLQTANQYVTFRTKDAFNGKEYYSSAAQTYSDGKLPISVTGLESFYETGKFRQGAVMYPILSDEYSICLDTNDVRNYYILNPGENLIIPILFDYRLGSTKDVTGGIYDKISKIMSFDIRTSLYSDPTNYTFQVNAKYSTNTQDKVISNNRKNLHTGIYHPVIIK